MARTRRLLILGLAIAVVPLAILARRDLRGLTLVVRGADLHGTIRRLADLDAVPSREVEVIIPFRGGSMRGRAYIPARSRQTVLLVSGLHPDGIDERRLRGVARIWAESGVTVVTPEIPELARFEINPDATDHIEDAALWLATKSDLTPTGRIGLAGVSFSGGLSIVAAGRSSLHGRLLYVFSFGGHDDLPRVLQYLCAGEDGGAMASTEPSPHVYGVVVVLLSVAERVVPGDQVEPLREAARRFLSASYLDRFDKPAADREFAALRDLARTLPEPSATLVGYVNDRDVAHLGPRLLPHATFFANRAGLSPSRSPAPVAPVFLLHGRSDNLIPAAESQYLADRLHGRVQVRVLVTDLISHVDPDQPTNVADVAKLARFWGALLAH